MMTSGARFSAEKIFMKYVQLNRLRVGRCVPALHSYVMRHLATWRTRAREIYQRHELAWHLGFFAAGFLLDIFATAEGIDHPAIVVQQVLYLLTISAILYVDFIREVRPGGWAFSPRLESFWAYRGLLLHFCFGTLMNVYSLFFLMSASFSSTIGCRTTGSIR